MLTTRNQKQQQEAKNSPVNAWLATEEDIRQADGEAISGTRGAVVDGQFARIGKLVKATEMAGGQKKTGLKWEVTVNGQRRHVDASQIKSTDFATAAIIRETASNPNFYGERFTNALMAANENSKIRNVGAFLMDAAKLRLAAYTGAAMPVTSIDRQTSIELFNASLQEHGENRKAQVAAANGGKAGIVSFHGAEYGTDAWKQEIKKANLTKSQKAQIGMIAGVAQRAGIAVTFRDAAEVTGQAGSTRDATMTYGWESGEGISVNLEGLDYILGENGSPEAKGQHHMVVTFGHEMTHWLQRNSMQGYNQLEAFVLGEMRKTGVDGKSLTQHIQTVMQNQDLSIEDAISEIVADGCDMILANESVAKHIQENHNGLFTEIKHFVKDLVSRVKNAIQGMSLSQSRESMAMMHSANKLAKIWLGAYDEAITGKVAETLTGDALEHPTPEFRMSRLVEMREAGVQKENIHFYEAGNEDDRIQVMKDIRNNTEGVRFSKAGVDPETGRTVYISNFSNETRNDPKRYRIVKLIRKIWSKQPIELTIRENGKQKKIVAHFDPTFDYSLKTRNTDAYKMAFANKQGSPHEKTVMLNLADDFFKNM